MWRRGTIAAGLGALAIGVLAASAELPAAAGSSTSPSDVRVDPHCRVRLTPGSESHAIEFTTRCNFQQRRLVIRPDHQVLGLDHSATVSQGASANHLRCHRRSPIVCRGRVSRGARASGLFETAVFSCDVATDVKVFGPAARLKVSRHVRKPQGCA